MDNNENNINNENLVEENTSANETNGVDENAGYVSQFGELTNADGEPLETTAPTEEPKKKFFLFKYIHPSIFNLCILSSTYCFWCLLDFWFKDNHRYMDERSREQQFSIFNC